MRRDATLEELAAARRVLAQRHHPDLGGDVSEMQAVNDAYRRALLERRVASEPAPSSTPSHTHSNPTPPAAATPPSRGGRVQHDAPSFTIDVLPVEAFEALLVVTSWIGEVLVDDPPYVLETALHEPGVCWCRLDLVPDAGATTVSLTVAGVGEGAPPHVEAVRDVWVDNLNRLGRHDPTPG